MDVIPCRRFGRGLNGKTYPSLRDVVGFAVSTDAISVDAARGARTQITRESRVMKF